MARKTKATAAELFLEAFGPGVSYRPYQKKDDEKLSNRIPGVMREVLLQEGWCSYKEQVLWLCDPDDWQIAARAWFSGAADAQVLARSGFGDLFVWNEDRFWFVMVHESTVMPTVNNPDWFFSRTLAREDFALQTYLPGEVQAARKAVGPLEWDEMYAYVPALALGGSESSSRIERVKAVESLVMLAGLAPIQRL